MESSIRKRGIKKLIVGAIAGLIVGYFVYWLQLQGYSPKGYALIVLGAPVAWGFVGLLEVLMNRPFSEMEEWWNSLKGWQKGVIGLVVTAIAFAIAIGAIATAGILGII